MRKQHITDDQYLDAKFARREKAEDRWFARMDIRWDDAETQIGEIVREGKTVYYIQPTDGVRNGRYREGDKCALIDFLIRNNYA